MLVVGGKLRRSFHQVRGVSDEGELLLEAAHQDLKWSRRGHGGRCKVCMETSTSVVIGVAEGRGNTC